MLRTAALLVALLVVPVATAYPDPAKAPLYYESGCISTFDRRFVHDYVGALDAEMASEVEGAACDIYAKTSAHFVLVAVDSTENEPLEPYALHLFEDWGVGDKGRLDGVMLLYVRDYARDGAQSAVRLEVGYGLTGVLDGITSSHIVREMRDAKQRALDAGGSDAEATSYALGMGSLIVLVLLDDHYAQGSFPRPDSGALAAARAVPPWVWILGIVLIVSILGALARSSRRGAAGWGYYHGSPHWSTGLASIFVSRMIRGGGPGRGGGGFGGGRSGGGGGSGGL